MRPLLDKIKPTKGVSSVVYMLFNILFPVLLCLLVRADLVTLAVVLLFISKWRMFAVRPRFWWPNIRTNAVDILVGLSAVAFMHLADTDLIALGFACIWATWLVFLKPRHSVFWVSVQAFLGMVVALLATFLIFKTAPLWVLVVIVASICFFSAHHFFHSFDEQYLRLLAYTWAYFGAALMWVLGHWLIFYGPIAQPTLILVTLGFGIGTLYYLDHYEKLSSLVRRQIIFIMAVTMLCIIVFSDWGDKIV